MPCNKKVLLRDKVTTRLELSIIILRIVYNPTSKYEVHSKYYSTEYVQIDMLSIISYIARYAEHINIIVLTAYIWICLAQHYRSTIMILVLQPSPPSPS